MQPTKYIMTVRAYLKFFLPVSISVLLIISLPLLAGENRPVDAVTPSEIITPEPVQEISLYETIGLEGIVDEAVFNKALKGFQKIDSDKNILVIADFSKPSTEKRFIVIDLDENRVLHHTLVAHGRNSGENMATKFSNIPGSFQSSLGFYKTGPIIHSPKHGPALLLHGLEKGFNDKALEREIIIHAADYVNESICKSQGRLGRSLGCPALPPQENEAIIKLIQNGTVMYIHGNDQQYLAQSAFLRD
jgi:hypothetical protein